MTPHPTKHVSTQLAAIARGPWGIRRCVARGASWIHDGHLAIIAKGGRGTTDASHDAALSTMLDHRATRPITKRSALPSIAGIRRVQLGPHPFDATYVDLVETLYPGAKWHVSRGYEWPAHAVVDGATVALLMMRKEHKS